MSYGLSPKGAYSSQIQRTVNDAEVLRFSDLAADLRAALEGEASLTADPTDPIILGFTIVPRAGGTLTFSARADVVAVGEDEEAEEGDLSDALAAKGRLVETSLQQEFGSRTYLRAWAWESVGDTSVVVDINLAWTDLAVAAHR